MGNTDTLNLIPTLLSDKINISLILKVVHLFNLSNSKLAWYNYLTDIAKAHVARNRKLIRERMSSFAMTSRMISFGLVPVNGWYLLGEFKFEIQSNPPVNLQKRT